MSIPKQPINVASISYLLRISHPKFVEATGTAIILIAALWSYLLIDNIDANIRAGDAQALAARLDSMEETLSSSVTFKYSMVQADREYSESLKKINDSYKNDRIFQAQRWFRFFMFVLGSALVVWAKIR